MILNLLFDLCRWKVEDGGVEIVHVGRWSTATCFFIKQAFIEAMGATIAIATRANVARG